MSFVADQVRRIDIQLDRLQLSGQSFILSAPPSPILTTSSFDTEHRSDEVFKGLPPLRIRELQAAVKSLSTASSSKPLLSSTRIQYLLEQGSFRPRETLASTQSEADASYESELEWLLIGKATAQTYGLILNILLEQTIPLSNDIWYWEEVLGSYRYTGLYTIQTSPLRLWDWSKDIYEDAWSRLDSRTRDGVKALTFASLADRWKHFYGLMKESVRERSLADVQRHVMSPFALSRAEARKKQHGLKRLREMSASGLGVLMDEGLSFDTDEEGAIARGNQAGSQDGEEWKNVVAKSVALMESILRNITTLEGGVTDFEDTIFATVEDDHELAQEPSSEENPIPRPLVLSARLRSILSVHVPQHTAVSSYLAKEYGRPSRLTRYWLPVTALLLSSSTLLRIFINRKAEIVTWVRELGTTVIDFWENWVVEPVKKVIGTIRHDKDSEVAIMSKGSLESDRASLERMVVDFAVDNPDTSGGAPLTENQIANVRSKVKEGDLTPVLRAYERDLRKPFMGTVRGDLVRALLIQVQKTKVDVEVAVGGIDALLKSQELVFGFVGLTPGILVCLGVSRWLGSFFGSRRGIKQGKKQGQMIRILRAMLPAYSSLSSNIDRILSASTSANNGMLSYKEHGLLLCEIHVLRQNAQRVLPGDIHREFLEEVDDLVDIRMGVNRQLKVVERMRWAYARWLR
ncbi:MAG: Nuclear control of ATPase protein 2 [Candelina mexicana]|nr:MAG: Nuclear control of ATPase protein 2 [Candelina mexicana]